MTTSKTIAAQSAPAEKCGASTLQAAQWQAVALTWPKLSHGIEASQPIKGGVFDTRGDALAAAELLMREIDGVGFSADPVRH